MRLRLAVLVFLIAPFLSAQTDDYVWYQTYLFPYVIETGPDKGAGAADLAMDLLDMKLSGELRPRISKPSIRIYEQLRDGDHALFPTAIKTPDRESYIRYSEPFVIINPLKFVSLADEDVPKQINDEFLAENRKMKIASVRGRSYGPVIDLMLKETDSRRITELTNLADEFPRLRLLLENRRIAGFFAYEDEVSALCDALDIPSELFSFSSVEGLDHIYASVAAPNTPWGIAMIERINLEIDSIKEPIARKYSLFLRPSSREEYLETSRRLLKY